MQSADMTALAEALFGTVLAAARLQMAHFAAGVAEETKADLSPVTAADRESEEILLEGLAHAAPGIPVVSEEATADGRIPSTGNTFFLVDPLDGTRSFLKQSPQFTINIALITNQRPVFGLVYAPAMPDFYVTLGPADARAMRLPPDTAIRSLAKCPLEQLHTRRPDRDALRALTSETSVTADTRRFLKQYNVAEARPFSSSLKFGLLARGEADLYPRNGTTSEWDTAAGHAVLAAAGGCVTTVDGQPLTYGKPKFLNPAFVAWGREPLAKGG